MKTLKIILLSILCCASALSLKAQQVPVNQTSIIKGVLVDDADSVPVLFANIALYNQKDSTVVTWTISGDNGSFELSKVPNGEYKLATSFVGYEIFTQNNITISKPNSVIDLGKIKLKKLATNLDAVTVVGVRKAVDSKIDKKVINVSKDINSTGGTAVDLIRNVPGLQVDADGVVSMRGNTGVSILVDGRPTSIDATRLDQISASEIESIEIITNPTAKYNPEGKSGIINLKLKQKKATGYSVSANFTVGTGNKYNGGLDLNYNLGKISFFASYNGMYKNIDATRYLLRESYTSDAAHFLQQDATTQLEIKSNKFSLGTNINLNSKNRLTLSYTNNPFSKIDADHTLSQYFDRSMNLTGSVFTVNSENSASNSQDYLLGYRKLFNKKDEELTVDYTFSNTNGDQNQPQTHHFADSTESLEIYTTTKSFNSNLQVNWVYPFNENSKIESGMQSIIRGTENEYSQKNLMSDEWIEDISQYNHFSYNEQIHSAYSTFSSKINALSFIAGLRIEQTYIDGNQTVNAQKINQKYFNFYPSLNLLYSLNQNDNLQFSFSRRINRPTARMINPFVDKSNLEVYRSGNPDLTPEYINSLEGGFNSTLKKTNYGLTLFYKNVSDQINQVTVLDSAGISHITPQNVGTGQNYGLELTFETLLTGWWKINGSGILYRNMIKSYDGQSSNSNYSYNARLNNVFTPLKKTSIQLVGNYTGPIVGLTSKMEPQFSIDLAVKRDFLNDKLALTLRATDIFNTLKNTYQSWGDNFTADNWRKMETRVFYVSLSYNFGSNGSAKKPKSNGNIESTHSTEAF